MSILESVKESLPSSLIDQEGYTRLAAVAEHLPVEITTFWGLECRLGRPDAKADILFQTINQSQGQRLLAGQKPSTLDFICERWPAWGKLRTFSRQWSDPEHPFHNHIRNVWLEFDTASSLSSDGAKNVISHPSIFFGPTKHAYNEQFFGLLIDVINTFDEKEPKFTKSLKSFIALLPNGAQLFQTGIMISRSNEGLRVCVKEVSSEYIPKWLAENGWDGDTQGMAGLLSEIVPLAQTIALDVDLTEKGMGEKIGLECYMDWLMDDTDQWRPLLDFIEAKGLCLPLKREGLLAFPGISRSPLSQRITSDGILFSNLQRKIHHIKLNFLDSDIVEAKVYLSLSRPGIHLSNVIGKSDGPWLAE